GYGRGPAPGGRCRRLAGGDDRHLAQLAFCRRASGVVPAAGQPEKLHGPCALGGLVGLSCRAKPKVKPKLLIVELWGLGDLVLATPFLRAAAETFEVSLVAKPYAQDLQARLWPGVNVLPFVAPWTAFRGKYVLHRWPWPGLFALQRQLRTADFEVGLSARWDPRD